MLSEKYIAGFLDSDGSIGLMWRPLDRADSNPELRRGYVTLSFTQEKSNDEVLSLIQKAIGGTIRDAKKNGKYSELRINGKDAEQVLNRIKKHLVVKRHYCEAVLSLARIPVKQHEAKRWLKEQRRKPSLPLPNYPSRKWMAGFLDGDGTIAARHPKGRTAAQVVLSATSADYDRESLDLLQKALGGSIRDKGGHTKWTLMVPPSKAKKVFGHCGPHMVVKKSQADFVLGCAAMGHYRDGKRINAALKHLKAHPHRLSESGAVVSRLLSDVRNLKTARVIASEQFEAKGGCFHCGAQEHYCSAVCRRCYDKGRAAA